MKRWLTVPLALLAAAALIPAGARATGNKFQKDTVRVDGGKRITYWVYTPQEEPESGLPMVVYLHGSGERGDRALKGGLPAMINDDKIVPPPAVYVVPQLPQGMAWSRIESQMLAMMEKVAEEYQTDENRVALTGASLGANAAWDLLSRWPDTFQRALLVCSRVRENVLLENMAACQIRVCVGLKDTNVPPASAIAFTQALMENGYDAELYEYDANHIQTQRKAFTDQSMIDWICWAEQETTETEEEITME